MLILNFFLKHLPFNLVHHVLKHELLTLPSDLSWPIPLLAHRKSSISFILLYWKQIYMYLHSKTKIQILLQENNQSIDSECPDILTLYREAWKWAVKMKVTFLFKIPYMKNTVSKINTLELIKKELFFIFWKLCFKSDWWTFWSEFDFYFSSVIIIYH